MFDSPPSVTTVIFITTSIVLQVPSMYLEDYSKMVHL
jgi:hypothetical protein